jgi:hypothetical protein
MFQTKKEKRERKVPNYFFKNPWLHQGKCSKKQAEMKENFARTLAQLM